VRDNDQFNTTTTHTERETRRETDRQTDTNEQRPPCRVSRGRQWSVWSCQAPSRRPVWYQCDVPTSTAASWRPPAGRGAASRRTLWCSQAAPQTSSSTRHTNTFYF